MTKLGVIVLTLLFPLAAVAQGTTQQAGKKQEDPKQPPAKATTMDQLYDLGRTLFEEYAPEEIKKDYEFPSREQWNAFLPRLQNAMEGESLDDLASLESEARLSLRFLDAEPEGAELTDWLRERLDLIEAAKELSKQPASPTPSGITPSPTPKPGVPRLKPVMPSKAVIPGFELWMTRLKDRPVPAAASPLLPTLKRAFVIEGLPADLVWIAEAESTFNPSARSPAGAKGLFQLMPDTAKSLGLSTWLPDERTHPEKSARAAARFLKGLHARLGDWPLALAAYNAGEGRVRRLLEKKGGRSFASIAGSLPAETRLYVPKVLALVNTRAGITPDRLETL